MLRIFLLVLLGHAFPWPAAGSEVAYDWWASSRAAEEEDDVALVQTALASVNAHTIAHSRHEWQGIKYVGAGLSRTGTESMMVAMKTLGENPTHGEEFKVDGSSAKLALSAAFLEMPASMLAILEHEDATCVFDSPLNQFVDLFRARYDSKVILTIHPHGADGWVDSIVRFAQYWQLDSAYQAPPFFVPRPGCSINVSANATITDEMRQYCKTSYEEYNAGIIKKVPQDHLLVYNVSKGWRPLCDFMGVTQCPSDVPFPHLDNVDFKIHQLCHSICTTNVSKCISTVNGKSTQSMQNDDLLALIPETARYPCEE